MSSILWFSRAFLLQSKNPKISVCINTKCLFTYSQKFTQTWPLTFIQENLSTSSQRSLPEATPSPRLSAVPMPCAHLSHAAPALSLLSELWVMLTFISHAYQTGSSQRPRGTVHFPSKSCPRLHTRKDQGGSFSWIATCFAAIKCMPLCPYFSLAVATSHEKRPNK